MCYMCNITGPVALKLWFPRKAVPLYYGRNVALCGVFRADEVAAAR